MDLSLKNRHALVGGSSQGIGKASAIELARLGADVTIMARSVDRLQETLGELDCSQNQQHQFQVVNTLNHEDLRQKISILVKAKPVHILVNNTGGPPGGPILVAKDEEFLEAIKNHVIGSHLISKLVIPGMKKEAYGRIINIISTSVKQPLDNLGVSNTTRAAVANWAKTMSNELAQFEITVNNVLPGSTETGRMDFILNQRAEINNTTAEKEKEKVMNHIPFRRFASAKEIAHAVAFLASPAASYITGINLPVDGGKTKTL